MTKKSMARQQRDALKKDQEELLKNNNWDELNSIYANACGLLASHAKIGDVLRDQKLLALIEDRTLLAQNIQILTKDLKTMQEELRLIHETHKDKTGSADIDTIMLSLEIFEKYNLFMMRVDAVLRPTMLHIVEQTHAAEVKLAEIEADEANGIKEGVLVEEVTQAN